MEGRSSSISMTYDACKKTFRESTLSENLLKSKNIGEAELTEPNVLTSQFDPMKRYVLKNVKLFVLPYTDPQGDIISFCQQVSSIIFEMNFEKEATKILRLDSIFDDKASKSELLTVPLPEHTIQLCDKHEFHYFNSMVNAMRYIEIEESVWAHLKQLSYILQIKNREDRSSILIVFGKNSSDCKLILFKVLRNLIYESRYSKKGLRDHLGYRIQKLISTAFKRYLFYIAQAFEINSWNIIDVLIEIGNKINQDEENMSKFKTILQNLKKEVKPLLYRTFLMEGFFPFKFEFNSMGQHRLKVILINWIAPRNVLPWGAEFHVSMNIGSIRYSFVDRGEVNNQDEENRHYRENFRYFQLKILDFMPKDKWLNDFEDIFTQNLLDFQFLNSLIMNVHAYTDLARNEDINMFLQILPSSLQKLSRIEYDELREAEVAERLHGYYIQQFLEKTIKKMIDQEIDEKIPLTKCFPISEDFRRTYDEQFYKKKFFKNICRVIADTEMRQYNRINNNCQTPVSEVIFITNNVFGKYIESLSHDDEINFLIDCMKFPERNEEPPNMLGGDRKLHEYFKYQSSITENLFKNNVIIKPCQLTTRLNLFCFFADVELRKVMDIFSSRGLVDPIDYNYQTTFNVRDCPEVNVSDDIPKELNEQQKKYFVRLKNNIFKEFLSFKRYLSKNLDASKSSEFLEESKHSDVLSSRYTNLTTSLKFYSEKANLSQSYRQSFDHQKAFSLNSPKKKKTNVRTDDPSKNDSENLYFLAYLLFFYDNRILNLARIKDSIQTEKKEIPVQRKINLEENRKEKFYTRILLQELYYFYFNSIRAKMACKSNQSIISYVGFVLVKDIMKNIGEKQQAA